MVNTLEMRTDINESESQGTLELRLPHVMIPNLGSSVTQEMDKQVLVVHEYLNILNTSKKIIAIVTERISHVN